MVLTDEEAVVEEETGLGVNHLQGLFYILLRLPVLCSIILIFEWFLACLGDIDHTDPDAPKSLTEARNIRLARLLSEILDPEKGDWGFIYSCFPGYVNLIIFRCTMVLNKYDNEVKWRKSTMKSMTDFETEKTLQDLAAETRMSVMHPPPQMKVSIKKLINSCAVHSKSLEIYELGPWSR